MPEDPAGRLTFRALRSSLSRLEAGVLEEPLPPRMLQALSLLARRSLDADGLDAVCVVLSAEREEATRFGLPDGGDHDRPAASRESGSPDPARPRPARDDRLRHPAPATG